MLLNSSICCCFIMIERYCCIFWTIRDNQILEVEFLGKDISLQILMFLNFLVRVKQSGIAVWENSIEAWSFCSDCPVYMFFGTIYYINLIPEVYKNHVCILCIVIQLLQCMWLQNACYWIQWSMRGLDVIIDIILI